MLSDKLAALYHDDSIAEKKARWVTLGEAQLLLDLAKEHQPAIIFESGTANGISSAWLSLSGVPVVTFDPCNRNKVWDKVGINDITYVKDRFSSVDTRYSKWAGEKKMFFIDGDHSSSGVQEDCEALKRFARSGDVVVFHDLNEKPVVRAWHRLLKFAQTYEKHDTPRIMGVLIWR